jgi:hypothetical protein
MFKYVLAFLLGITTSIANAESFNLTKPVVCDDTIVIIQSLHKTHKEKIIWVGQDNNDESRFGLFVNEKTGSWTLLQMTPKVSCILGVGENAKMFSGQQS